MTVERDPVRGTWLFVIDLPAGPEGKCRQHRRRGLGSRAAAVKAESEAIDSFRGVAPAADGTVEAELTAWLDERVCS